MDREHHKLIGEHMVELVPARVFPDATRLIAHGVVTPKSAIPCGLTVGLYRIAADRSVAPVVIEGELQLLGTHKAGAAALAGLLAEADATCTIAPMGSA